MDIIPNTIPVCPQTAKVGKSTKDGGSTSKNSKESSFSAALGSAVRSTMDPKEQSSEKNDQQDLLEKPVSATGASIPLLNLIPILPMNSTLPLTADGEEIRTDAMPDSITPSVLNAVNTVSNQVAYTVSDQMASTVSKVTTGIEVLPDHQERQQLEKPSLSQVVNIDELPPQPVSNQTTNTVPIVSLSRDNKEATQSIVQSKSKQADDSNTGVPGKQVELTDLQAKSKDNIQSLNVTLTESAPSNYLKPLQSAATYKQATLSVDNKFNENEQTNQSLQPIGTVEADNQSVHIPVASATISANVQQEMKNSLTTSDDLDVSKQNPDNAADRPVVAFQHVLNLVSKSAAPIAEQVVNQPTSLNVQDPNNVINQIVEHARLIKSPEASEMVIKLKPEHLGELTLKVAVDQGVVSATFHTNNNEVRGIIESSVQQLRQDMSHQGLKVEYVGVSAGLGQPFSNGQDEANKQQAWKPQSAKKITDDVSEALVSIEKVNPLASDSGVDYRI